MKTAILGNTGMLGSMVCNTWQGDFTSFDRNALNAEYPENNPLKDFDWVVNCVGVIKPYCTNVERAIRVNSLFPFYLPDNTIQIATDCVYSGKKGSYVETDPHDATDVYGKTKSLGEAPHIKNLRCSIIGREVKNHLSLVDWFLAQDSAKGFTNHLWNGITTYHYALIAEGAIKHGIELPNIQHIVPADVVTKASLLEILAQAYNKDIPIERVEAPEAVDRTLSTNDPALNLALWSAAGYKEPPTIARMIQEMADL